MLRSFAVGGVLALCLAASPAAAEPMESFLKLCMQTNVDSAAAGAIAKSEGWVEVPSETLGEQPMFEDPRLYLSHDPAEFGSKPPADLDILVTGWGTGEDVFGVAGVKMDACAVAALSSDRDDLISRLGQFLGFEPTMLDGESVWVFSPEGSGFRSRSDLMDEDESEFLRIVQREKLLMAGVMETDGTNVIVIGAIRPTD